MANTSLVERTREVVSAESDDFFNAETILYYINKAQRKVTSYMVQTEADMNKSLRALDKLRKSLTVDTSTLSYNDSGNYYSVLVPFPSTAGEEINQFSFLKFGERTVLRELTQDNLVKLEWGNLRPTLFESYYQITNDNTGQTSFELYLDQDYSGAPAGDSEVKIYYVLNPEELALTDAELHGLPEQLENAVVYAAAAMMVMQESVKDPSGQVQLFNRLYNEELKAGAY